MSAEAIAARIRDDYEGAVCDPAFWADQVRIWHNFDDDPVTVEGGNVAKGGITEFAAFRGLAGDYRADPFMVDAAGDRAFVQVRETGTLADGTAFRLDRAYVLTVSDGRVSRFDAYMDREQFSIVSGFLQEQMQQRA